MIPGGVSAIVTQINTQTPLDSLISVIALRLNSRFFIYFNSGYYRIERSLLIARNLSLPAEAPRQLPPSIVAYLLRVDSPAARIEIMNLESRSSRR